MAANGAPGSAPYGTPCGSRAALIRSVRPGVAPVTTAFVLASGGTSTGLRSTDRRGFGGVHQEHMTAPSLLSLMGDTDGISNSDQLALNGLQPPARA
ncbi:protein of unknown function [Streptantibioticus cattleyicolor NRRL 8057 = DSM 46488]|nr:protein of unknown function [Streptantibioticus cattleyicolor NRRL 8057 = DSM 46488]